MPGLMSRFAVVLLLASATACSVGEVPLAGGGDDTPGIDSGSGSNALCPPRQATPTAAHQHSAASNVPADNPTAKGLACMTCHIAGGTSTPFTAAGTVFKPDKVTPQPGVTVRVFPSGGGAAITAVTDSDGNFRFEGTIAFPASTDACADTATALMVSPLNGPTEGNCNSAGCHQEPGGAYGAIKLTAD